jgi:signal transduction histidine kinase
MVLLSVRPMYRTLRYIDSEGIEQITVTSDGQTVRSDPQRRDRSDAHYFQNVIALPPGSTFVSAFTHEQEMDDPGDTSYIHYALHMPDDTGVIVVDLHTGWLLRNLPTNPGSDMWALLDQNGRFLVYPEGFDPTGHHDSVAPMLTGGRGTFETSQSVYAYDTIHPSINTADQFWMIFRRTPKSVLYADLESFYLAAAGFTHSGVGLAALLAWAMSRILTKPIIRLEQMAAEFGRSGTPPPLPAQLPADEIGSLTHTFCAMALELDRKRKQEHRLIEQLIKAQEEERKLVAYDLHDGLLQQLVGARFYLSNSRDTCNRVEGEGCSRVRQGCAVLTEAIVEGRRIIEGLRPAVLDDLGLTAAIEEVARGSASASGWELTLALDTVPADLDKSVAVTLYRIIQEALNNARKHASANHVAIALHNGQGIEVVVTDNGSGFDSAALHAESRGLGITTMRERASLLGGTCTIDSTPGYGTTIRVWVPSMLSPQPSSLAAEMYG